MIYPPLETVTPDRMILRAVVHEWATGTAVGNKELVNKLSQSELQGWNVVNIDYIGNIEQPKIMLAGQAPTTLDSIIWSLVFNRPKWEPVGMIAEDGVTRLPLPQNMVKTPPVDDNTA